MTIRNLDGLFKPKSIALFGASEKEGAIGTIATRNLLDSSYAGSLMLVNPKYKSVFGEPCYADLGKLPENPDLAIISTTPSSVPRLVRKLGKAGTRGVIILTAGFDQAAAWRAEKLQQQVLDAAKPYLLRVIGPNTLGVMLPRLGVNASYAHINAKPGKLALVTQSGAMVSAILDSATPNDIGFSHVVPLGGMCDVDFGDMLNYLAMDVDTDVILLYIESVSGTRKFMSAARAAARAKPVIVVKAGYSESLLGSVASHTHALVNSDAVYDAVFRRTGMLRVYSIEELFDAAQTLSQLRKPKGDRLAIVTNGGGVGVLAADALVKRRGHLAGLSDATLDKLDSLLPVCWSGINPVDIVGDADGQRYVDTMEVLFDDDNVDAILAINCPGAIGSSTASAQAVIEMMAARKSLPIFTSWVGKDSPVEARRQFAESKIPTYPTPEHAVRAFMHVVNYYQGKELLMQTPPSVPQQFSPDHGFARQLIDAALEEGREWLTEPESKALLEAYGVPVVTTKTAHTVEEAGSIAAELGSNVVLKILSPEINHKSDVGGVALDLFGSSMVVEAAQAMADRLLAELPQAHISGFSVQPMVRRADAYELIIGMINDPEFGPILLFGQGGTAVEEIDDEALGLPPLNMRLARELISRTRIYRLLDGYRGRSPVNIDAIALTLIKVGQLVIDHAEIAALDINPLICDEAGVMALDARIRLEPCQMSGAERLAIKPYPKELEETIGLEGDVELMIRPIVPEDEPSLHESFTHLTPREIYQRFFTPLKSMTHMMAARFTQLDYDRDMALVLTEPGIAGKTPIYGVVRLAADPDKERAEFAIIVGNIMSGKGLGMAMMQRIINYARHAGIKEVYGDVLRDNEAMLGLCTKLGFSRSAVPDDSTITHVSLVL